MSNIPLLEVLNLHKWYEERVGILKSPRRFEAVHDISFEITQGGSLAIVGESGSGKTTTARMIIGLEEPSKGTIKINGMPLGLRPSAEERRNRARKLQIVFQNPYLSLDPQQRVGAAVEEVTKFHGEIRGAQIREHARELLDAVGLGDREFHALPRQLSGGQAQRVAIARALAARPQLLVLDEAVSALDVSVQAQILNLLADLRTRLGVALLFISHNLAAVRQVADTVLVMYRGRVVESGFVDTVLSHAAHPYTQLLLASVPRPGVSWVSNPVTEDIETGCRFRNRCGYAFPACEVEPPLIEIANHQKCRCWLTQVNSGTSFDC